ncbi:SPOR domain-containing protein [Phenylobacterium sp. LjRoot219]|uniref:SPOR domain-containing protein n=1 Tax=Phenylobacterium sp. LjRoot219 TaxID=3342283 RepID=UPI003ECF4285
MKPKSVRSPAVSAGLAALVLLAGPASAAPSYPPDLDRDSLSAWLRQATDLAPEQVVAVTASAAAAVVTRTPQPNGRTKLLLRAVSLSQEATARSGVLAWQVSLEVDCRSGEVWAGATTGYGARTGAGEAIELAPGEAAWRRPRAGTPLESAWQSVCEPGFQPPLGPPRAQLASLPSPSRASTSRPAAAFAHNAAAKASATETQAKPGRWVVQVVSSPDAADTRQALAGLRSRYADALQALETRVEPAQVRGRTVYRGVVAGFASSDQASEFCATLKRNGRDCLTR